MRAIQRVHKSSLWQIASADFEILLKDAEPDSLVAYQIGEQYRHARIVKVEWPMIWVGDSEVSPMPLHHCYFCRLDCGDRAWVRA